MACPLLWAAIIRTVTSIGLVPRHKVNSFSYRHHMNKKEDDSFYIWLLVGQTVNYIASHKCVR